MILTRSIFLLVLAGLALPSLSLSPTTISPQRRQIADIECGSRDPHYMPPLILIPVVEIQKWPWHGGLFHRGNQDTPSYACGLTILNKRYVMTAGYCVMSRASRRKVMNASELLVRLGMTNQDRMEPSVQEFTVEEVVTSETNPFYKGIALLKLSRDVQFGEAVRPICLWEGDYSKEQLFGRNGTVVGWPREGVHSDGVLRDLPVPVISDTDCRHSAGEEFGSIIEKWTFCVRSVAGKTIDHGDAGGGLFMKDSDKWYVRGIVGYAERTDYALYLDVGYFVPWIRTIISDT